MKSMIYYPGFEIEDISCLKFALLYFEELRPIIPFLPLSEEQYLSENAITVMKETNLIRPYAPTYVEGCCASVIACDEFEKYLQNPQRYSPLFYSNYNVDMVKKWKKRDNQTCCLYNEKFSTTFHEYCIKNNLATQFNHGIMISKDLAFVYMSFLADVISKNQECEMFTDISKYHTLLLRNDQQISYSQKLQYKIARTQIEFFIPKEINTIPLSEIIKLRNDRDFNECRKAYVKEIEQYLLLREENLNFSFKDQLKVKKDLIRILNLTLGTTASVYLTCSSALSLMNGSMEPTMALATAYTDFVMLKDIYNAPQYLETIKTKLQARRYLAQIKKI